MASEAALQVLENRLREANQAFDNLLWATVEGQPPRGPGHALVDHYETLTTDAIDHVREAFGRIRTARRAPHSRPGMVSRVTALCDGSERVSKLVDCMLNDLGSMSRIAALDRLAAERKGVWAAWAHGVKDSIEECQRSVNACAAALPNCWREMLNQILPALTEPRVSATGAKIILNGADAKVSNETETETVTGSSDNETEKRQTGQRV